jgi:hypothetical protein
MAPAPRMVSAGCRSPRCSTASRNAATMKIFIAVGSGKSHPESTRYCTPMRGSPTTVAIRAHLNVEQMRRLAWGRVGVRLDIGVAFCSVSVKNGRVGVPVFSQRRYRCISLLHAMINIARIVTTHNAVRWIHSASQVTRANTENVDWPTASSRDALDQHKAAQSMACLHRSCMAG